MTSAWLQRTTATIAVLLAGAQLSWAQSDDLLVTDVFATQFADPGMVIVTYNLETVGDVPVFVTLHLSIDGGVSYPLLCQSVVGDVGTGVLPGTNKYIVWNAGADFPGIVSSSCVIRVTADDGDLVLVEPGSFSMGSPSDELGRGTDEAQHQVALTRGYYMQATEVTNQQYRDVAQWAYDNGYVTATTIGLFDALDGSTQLLKTLGAGGHEIAFSDGVFNCINPSHPVKNLTWYGAVAYCDWLSLQQNLPRAYDHSTWQCNGGNPYTAEGYRLPTEAEWEYACRAGTQTPFSTGVCLDASTEANYRGSEPYPGCPAGPSIGWTVPVGSYPANAIGLYDMHGNLWEWCNDWYGMYGGAVTDPVGAGVGSSRVIRGGARNDEAWHCRSANRHAEIPVTWQYNIGFRPVRLSL